jgi:LysM repeat protein
VTPRQMGKSSLMIRTAQRLMDEGIRSAIVDLTQTGTVESEDQWYKGILSQIQRRLRMKLNPVQWWEQKEDIPNIQKFIEFFEETLVEIKEHVVIFMDEIDTTLKLDFRDNFFAGIRALYNARAENPDLKRVTFVLLGVASPSDLIKDRSRTPFNIGHEIPLKPFSRGDASMLEQGLEAAYPGLGARIFNRVFYWTNGHPYLTQKICQSLVDEPIQEYDDSRVDELVEKLFVSEQASGETNLQFVRESVLYAPDRKENLSLYKKVLEEKEVRDNKNSVAQNHLKLAGLVRVEEGRLVVNNRIYARVFDLAWVNRYTEVNWSRRVSIALGVVVALLLAVFAYNSAYLPSRAQQDSDDATMYNDDRGIHALAEMLQLKPFLLPNEYEYKAKDLFFNTLSRDDQLALIKIDPYNEMKVADRPEFKEDYITLIKGLYTSLADVDRSGQSTELLDTMKTSLETLHMQEDPLYVEISAWVLARQDASDGDTSGAMIHYNQAIEKNQSNPATHFERARLYALEGSTFEEALKDYDTVLGIVPESDIEPTPGPAPTGASAAAGSASPVPPTAAVTEELTPVAKSTEAVIISTLAADMAASATLAAPTSTLPFQSRFMTRGQRIAAVKSDILQNPALSAIYVQAQKGTYPYLVASIPQQTETPGPQAANPRQTVTITPFANLVRGATITHTVVEGDWLEQIARCYGADLSTIQSANPKITDPREVLTVSSVVVPNIGSVGTIYGPPCVQFYTVATGDTWQSIADQFNAALAVLLAANPGVSLTPGQKIKVPVNSGGSLTPVSIISATPAEAAVQPIPFIFPPGNPSSVSEIGTITTPGTVRYRFPASAGQTLTVELQVSTNDVNLAIFDPNGVNLKPRVASPSWSGTLAKTGDYIIELDSSAGNASKPYLLIVTASTPAVSTQIVPDVATQSAVMPPTDVPTSDASKIPTITPTQIPMLHLDRNSFCRAGPGTASPVVATFLAGQRLPIIGQTSNGWWKIKLFPPSSGYNACWIFGNTPEGDSSSAPVSTP